MSNDSFFSRLHSRIHEANQNSESFITDAADEAGRAAEHEVSLDLTKRLTGTGWEFCDNVRVPDPTRRRQRELDFVITSPTEGIIVELKNWSGRLEMADDGAVIQHRRYNKGPENHGNLFSDLNERVEVLHLHHCSRGRLPIQIRGYVIFFNDNLEIPEVIAQRKDVLTYTKLLSFMPPTIEEPSLLKRILLAIMRFFGAKSEDKEQPAPALPSDRVVSFRETLAELGSWDVLDLYGGGYVFGDIQTPLALGLQDPSYAFDRVQTRTLDVDVVDRSVLLALFRDPAPCATARVTRWDGVCQAVNIRTNFPIKVRPAGEKAVAEYQIRNVLRLTFGYMKRPRFTLTYDDLSEGMLLVGKVGRTKDFGTFIDIGLRGKNGQPRDVLAPARGHSTASRVPPFGARVLVRIEKLVEATERVFVALEVPQTA